MTRIILVIALLAACPEHGRSPADGALPPEEAELCSTVSCGAGQHCEIECQISGISSCATDCNRVCVPDQACTQTTCGIADQCAVSCTHDCGATSWQCSETCIAPADPLPCELIRDSMMCVGRGDCTALFAVQGCSCAAEGCSCTGPRTGTGFLHCATR